MITEEQKKTLLTGTVLTFESTTDPDDRRQAELSLSKAGIFVIWFNGKVIDAFRTFKAFNRRFEKLENDWKLIPIDPE